jgi:hypothetical protein
MMMTTAKIIADIPLIEPWRSWLPMKKAYKISSSPRVVVQSLHYHLKLHVHAKFPVRSKLPVRGG